ncbi:hypothetical protein EG329_006558 [Mollisiaceae sp. DMI_Dod_QoI]|nr:hypothetical protein EG329_006558 [Helotiales sp. DMI_Dod_QoI]
MERQIDGDRNFLNPSMSLPSPIQPAAIFNNFGGIRHGFNNPVSDRIHNYPTSARSNVYPNVLPPLSTMACTPSGFSVGLASQAQTYSTVPNSGMRRLYSLGEDVQMITPASSRRTSRMHGLESTADRCASKAQVCVSPSYEAPVFKLATDAYNMMQPYPRLPVTDLLNAAPTSSLPSMASHGVEASQTPAVDDNTDTVSIQRQMTPISMSTYSTATSSSTIRPSFNITEERCFLLSTLYNTCLEAAASYALISIPSSRRRHCGTGTRAVPRYHPYSPRPNSSYCTQSSTAFGARKETKKSKTLMDSISTICTRLWRKARRDGMAPHRAEADAVRDMRDLYAWSEVVAKCMESDGLEDGESGLESDDHGLENGRASETLEGTGFPGMRVAKAAKCICQWLGDEDAWDTCDTVMGELRDLAEDGRGGGGSEFETIL